MVCSMAQCRGLRRSDYDLRDKAMLDSTARSQEVRGMKPLLFSVCLLLNAVTVWTPGCRPVIQRCNRLQVPAVAQQTPNPSTETGEPVRAVKKARTLRCVVTAYCDVPRWSSWTAAQRIGTCAVDPRVIPYGSIVRVAGRNLTAMGRHGKNGRVIDIFMAKKSDCVKFGRRTLTVREEARR